MSKKNANAVLVLFLLGIFMGAIDNGIVSPAREIIQNGFGVSRNIGVWMITAYTLTYAISMPIVSKMADRYGRKKIYCIGIAVFGIGSLMCGLGNLHGNFTLFVVCRIIQATGAGGIIPIATSVIGNSFPEEKRGTALGFVGAMYGIASIVGPTLGSAIISVAGINNWGWIFFINVPISIAILVLSGVIQESVVKQIKALDIKGSVAIAVVIGSLMYSLTNINFFEFGKSISRTDVYPFLIIFSVFIPILIYIENRAEDPVLNIRYFKDRQMLSVFIVAFIVGVGMMGIIFVPQFAENVLRIKVGKGGYLVTLLAVFSGIAAPLSGRLIDKKGARCILKFGFLFTIIGSIILGFYATKVLTFASVFVGLAFMGFGMGFTMGTPLNYIVLQAVPKEEGATALATMSLIRSIGVSISPSIMIGFIVDAAKQLQGNLMGVMQKSFGTMMPTAASMSGNSATAKQFSKLQTADVTTIVDKLKDVFKTIIPAPYSSMALDGIEKIRSSIESAFQTTINMGYRNMFTTVAIIATVGFIATFFLKGKENKTV